MNPETRKKKVLYFVTKATWGGAQRYVLDLVSHVPQDRFEPVVAYGVAGRLSESLRSLNIRTIQIPSLDRDIAIFADIASFFQIYNCIRAERPDVVHLNSSKAAAFGALAARLARVPRIVFTVHGWPFKEDRNAILRGIIYILSVLTAVWSDEVIVVSTQDQEAGLKMGSIAKKIVYVPIGFEPPAYLSKEDALQELWKMVSAEKIPQNAVKVGTIAELTPNKGIKYAIEALADLIKHIDANYVYIVFGEGEQRAELESLAKKLGVADKVFLLGFLPDAARLIKAFDIFLLPSIKEGMPYVLLEAGESGVATIATKVANEALLQQYENMRFIGQANVIAIADMIRKLPELVRDVPQKPGRFSLTKMVEDTVALY